VFTVVRSDENTEVVMQQKIVPFLWFDDEAEEAMSFYASIFKDSEIVDVTRYGEAGPGKPGTVMVGTFKIAGQEFMALNGGPLFKFNESISFHVTCESQEEVDDFWEKLTDGGEESQCGWLKDKFGVSWQIVPTALGEMLSDPDPERSRRAMEAMLQMKKIDIATMRRAFDGE
jgi:predicted 3-demethylubiquinone-9 3-methyltransferase (glyoxalase superfamily)